MQDTRNCLEEDFIIWSPEFGVSAFVTLGQIQSQKAWLDEPYEMVGPFCLDELFEIGKIDFEACMVMTKQYWRKAQAHLREESLFKQHEAQTKFNEAIKKHNKARAHSLLQNSEAAHRKLLCLPLEEQLQEPQIKEAYRKVAKSAHPDVGGSHEAFIEITQARDILLENWAC